MRRLVEEIAKLCGYGHIRLTGFNLSRLVAVSNPAPEARVYFDSCVPRTLIERPFFSLLSPEGIETAHRNRLPGAFVYSWGYVVFGSECNGDAIAVELDSGRVFVLSHETYSERGIARTCRTEYLPVTAANIADTALAQFASITEFLLHWREILIQLDHSNRKFMEAAKRDPNAIDEDGNHLIIRAIRQGSIAAVEAEVQRGADIELIAGSGHAALGEAIVFGQTHIASYLLSRGASVNARYKNGITPLMLAARYAKLDCLKLLLAAGADVDARDDQGQDALDHLCVIRGTPAMRELIQHNKQSL